MTRALALHGERFNAASDIVERAQILNRERIVRRSDNLGNVGRVILPKRVLKRRGIAFPALYHKVEFIAFHAVFNGAGSLFQRGNIAAFASEREHIYAVQRGNHAHSAPRKALRRHQRISCGQLYHKVRAVFEGGFRARIFVEYRKIAALNEISAHNAHDMGCARFARFVKQELMPEMKWVVLAYNSGDFHIRTSEWNDFAKRNIFLSNTA